MRFSVLALALLLAGRLGALGSSVTWLGGTLPFDTVPYLEADPKLGWSAGSGRPELGAGLDIGLTDGWMLQGEWSKALDEARSDGRVLTRLKLHRADWHGFGAGAFGGLRLPEGAAGLPLAGLILSFDGPFIFAAVNVARLGELGYEGSAGFWGPYLAYALRPGLEFGWSSGDLKAPLWWLPQLALNLGGDLSIDLGLRIADDPARTWRVLTRISFQLFPNP